jgi:hypothetical protein
MPSTGSVTATTIRLQSSSSLGLHPFMPVCVPALAGLDEGTFTEGHELDRKTTKQVPKAMIGRRLSQEEAKRLLGEGDSPSLLGGQARMVGMT